MPTPTIPDGRLFMNATTYTGNGSTQTITNGGTGTSFQPDFVWVKSRSNAQDHILGNTVVGVNINLYSNRTNAEVTNNSGGYISAVTSTGFTVTTGSTNALDTNGSTYTYVGWQWKAGGTAVSNTSGTITSQVSANTTSGFSVVTYTGNGTSGATVGHGLGVTPGMIIYRSRSSVENWQVWHTSLTNGTYAVYLNLTNAQGVGNFLAAPTSTVSNQLNTSTGLNGSGSTYVAYCWAPVAGYSKFGSYTGNGSADGAFIYTGFRPKFIMQKASSTTGQWMMFDTSRNTYNVLTNAELLANSSAVEGAGGWGTDMDILSNGFKFRGFDNTNFNYTGVTYIYAAFAENPFKYSNAR
jgi:hypothetical protein